jgi:hypothetical protein
MNQASADDAYSAIGAAINAGLTCKFLCVAIPRRGDDRRMQHPRGALDSGE